ncbi:MAG: ATP-binding protein [Cytophagales bacterium]|nr:ATP-binding protein [Bernardetiaceae bacterium]MDW8209572.1 ATP-binding protein [Cytophagales bacterium]
MKIRQRLALTFTTLTTVILMLFALVAYYAASVAREKEFYNLLQKEAITKANLFFNAGIDAFTLQSIYHTNRKILNEVEVAIYDTAFQLLYHDAVDIDFVKESPEMLASIFSRKMLKFYQQRWQIIGIVYQYQGNSYAITAAAYDQHGYNKLHALQSTLILALLAVIGISYGIGWRFAGQMLAPITAMTLQARKISATHLNLRLPIGRHRDELAELAATFNQMLERLEHSFEAQKNFVSNIAHELRTPLSTLIAGLELALTTSQTQQDYQDTLQKALSDAQYLAKIITHLLDLARAEYDTTQIRFRPLRIDEILLDARQEILQRHPDYNIDISFENEPETEEQLLLEGDEYLLKTAFANLMENGCKFSHQKCCKIKLSLVEQHPVVEIMDEGIGISPEDLPHLFEPFYRGANASFAQGSGIGLSLVQKIIHLHKGTIQISSAVGKGTRFLITF